MMQPIIHPLHEQAPQLGRHAAQLERAGSEAYLPHPEPREHEQRDHHAGANEIRDVEMNLTQQSARDGTEQHSHAEHHLPACEDGFERRAVARGLQGVHEPGIHRSRVERVSQPEKHRNPAERREAPAAPRRADVEQRRDEECAETQQQRHTAPDGISHHAGRDLEHHGAGGERGVGEHDLENVETGAKLEQRVHAPNQGHGEVEEKCDREVGTDDSRAHASPRSASTMRKRPWSLVPRHRTLSPASARIRVNVSAEYLYEWFISTRSPAVRASVSPPTRATTSRRGTKYFASGERAGKRGASRTLKRHSPPASPMAAAVTGAPAKRRFQG